MRLSFVIFSFAFRSLFGADSYEVQIRNSVDSLRKIVATEDTKELEKNNAIMDGNWTVFKKDTSASIPILTRILRAEIDSKDASDLVILDLAWFLTFSEKKSELNALLLQAYKKIDYRKKIISHNGEQYFRLSLVLSARQVPDFLSLMDARFLKKSSGSFFVPQHLATVDSHSQRTHLYGIYGEPSIKHLLKLLKAEPDVSMRRSLSSILRRICAVECAEDISKWLLTEKDHEAFTNGTYILLDNAGPAGREAYLKLEPKGLSAKTDDYFKSEKEYVRKVNFAYLMKQIERKFGQSPNSFSDSEIVSQIEKMIENLGSTDTLHPIDILRSKIDRQILIEKLKEARRRSFYRINRHGMEDIDSINMILNALYYEK